MTLNKIQSLYQKFIRLPKIFLTIFVFILIISLFYFFTRRQISLVPPTTTPSVSITPYIGPITIEEPYPTPPLNINWTNQNIEVPSNLDIYAVTEALINQKTINLFAKNFGFNPADEQASIDESLRIWSKDSRTLLANFKENTLYFESGTLPQSLDKTSTTDNYLIAAKSYLDSIFGPSFTTPLINQELAYFTEDSTQTTPEKATLIRVTYYQSVNNYPLATISQTGSIVTLFLDKNLRLSSLNVKNAYSTIKSIGKFNTTNLSDLISQSNSFAQRINSSDNIDISVETISVKNINFNQSTVKVAYLSKNQQLIPVYLLEGSISTTSTPKQFALYVLPVITQSNR